MCYLWFVIGIVSGVIITSILWWVKTLSGRLKIDHSNPEKDLYRLEIGDLDKVRKKKYLFLKIEDNADLSQN